MPADLLLDVLSWMPSVCAVPCVMDENVCHVSPQALCAGSCRGCDMILKHLCAVLPAEFVSCPSCGRTLFDLQEVTDQIRTRTGHLPGQHHHSCHMASTCTIWNAQKLYSMQWPHACSEKTVMGAHAKLLQTCTYIHVCILLTYVYSYNLYTGFTPQLQH